MKIGGSIAIRAPSEAIAAALHEPQVLQRMLPACTAVDHLGQGQFRGYLARKVGLLTLRVEPDITLRPLTGRAGHELSVDVASRIAGSFAARLALVTQGEGDGTRLSWDGTIVTTGLAQRLLAERQDQIDARMTGLFLTLKDIIERG